MAGEAAHGSGSAVLTAQRRLAESAGGTYHQLADQDIPAALLAFVHAHHATQLVLGATTPTWLAALRPAASIRSRIILLQPVAGVGLMQAHARVAAWWAT
jgi:K+-sensing histidine kinase KdpD